MFLDGLLKVLRAPIDALRGRQNVVNSVKGGIRGDINRIKHTAGEYKGHASSGKEAMQKAGGASGQGAGQQGQPKKAKMGLFSKKKKCPGCGEKLHVSWDQCPYCGWAAGAVSAPALSGGEGKSRTMAIDMGAQAGGGGSAAVGWLVPLEGPQSGELFQLKHRSVVGTAADCDVVLRDGSISSRHAEFIATGSGFRVNDLGSTNGTFVNDKRITSHDLVDNDNVRLGRTPFKFKSMN